MYSDETSFPQGNRDGGNKSKTKGWVWGLLTPLVCFFEVVLSRSQATAQSLIGELCWAHLKRDLQALAERGGASKQIGETLLSQERQLFQWWHRVRDGTLSRETCQAAVVHLRAGFKAQLEEAAALPLKRRESHPLAKTIRTCRKLLKLEAALWTFVDTPGIEPANNAAERALRAAVIWRRTSFGSQSQAGNQFVARVLAVTASLKAQQRSPLDFLTQVRSKIPNSYSLLRRLGRLPKEG
ncbi:transposase [Synechococcus sp. PCC 7336]|uniref:IS66 family transposase n=1 Tax=Synechococcus sp. PCC 7336 TaxID=195250 RepID=UPI000344DF58|nr:transposase [Synechococcus sp. PCC 7336]